MLIQNHANLNMWKMDHENQKIINHADLILMEITTYIQDYLPKNKHMHVTNTCALEHKTTC